MFGVRKYLEETGQTLDSLFNKISLKNPSELNQLELQKIIQTVGCTFDTMDIY